MRIGPNQLSILRILRINPNQFFEEDSLIKLAGLSKVNEYSIKLSLYRLKEKNLVEKDVKFEVVKLEYGGRITKFFEYYKITELGIVAVNRINGIPEI